MTKYNNILFILFLLSILILIYIYVQISKRRENFIDKYVLSDNNKIYTLDELNNIFVDISGNDMNETVFQYFYMTGDKQYFDIPVNIDQITFYCWGAGGGVKIMEIDTNDKTYPFLLDSYTNTVIKPILWYKFDGNLILDDSGNHNLTNVGGVIDMNQYRKGSNSILLRNNGYIVIPNKFELNQINVLDGISILFWVRLDANSNMNAKIIEFGRSDRYITIKREGIRLKFQILDGINDHNYITPENINYFDNKWIYIIWMINRDGEWTIYINNQRMVRNEKKNVIPLFYEKFNYYMGQMMTGNIDDFRIYSKILNEMEMKILYEGSMKNSIIGLGGTGGFVRGSITNLDEFRNKYGNRLRVIVGEGGKMNGGDSRAYLGGGVGNNGGGGGGLSGIFTDIERLSIPLLIAGGGGGGGGELYNKEFPKKSYSRIIMDGKSDDVYICVNDIPRRFPSRKWDSISKREIFVFNGKECMKQILKISNEGDYEIYYTTNDLVGDNNVSGMFNFSMNESDGIFGYIYDKKSNNMKSSYLVANNYIGHWIVIKMINPIIISSYRIKRPTSVKYQSPISFRVYASMDGSGWTIIDDVLEASYDFMNYYNKNLVINNVYRYFGLVLKNTSNNINNKFQIQEWEIYGFEVNKMDDFINMNKDNFSTYYGGNGGGEIGMDGNGKNDMNGKGGNKTIGGEAGESFMKNDMNRGISYNGGSGNINQSGGGSGYYGGGSSGNKYENGKVVAMGGGGGGSSYIGINYLSFNKDTIINIGNQRNGIIKSPMNDNRYYLNGVGETGQDGLVVIEYKRLIDTTREDNSRYNKCKYIYVKYPRIIVNMNDVSMINKSYLLNDTYVIYTQTYKGIEISYSSYKDENNTPIYLFDGNYKTNAYFGVDKSNGYDIITGDYIGTNKFMGDGIDINGEWLMIKLDKRIKLRKYEFVINVNKLFNTMSVGKWKLYGKSDNNSYILLDEMNTRMTTDKKREYYYKTDENDENIHMFMKNICDNEFESDTYVLIINGLALMGKTTKRATMCYLGFSELKIYDGIDSNIMATTRINPINTEIKLVTR